jgi:hypothetical protein
MDLNPTCCGFGGSQSANAVRLLAAEAPHARGQIIEEASKRS